MAERATGSAKTLGGSERQFGAGKDTRRFQFAGQELSVGEKVGEGGEKDVYAVDGRSEIVVAIAKAHVTESRLMTEALQLREAAELGIPVA